jgi:hypothetical protein
MHTNGQAKGDTRTASLRSRVARVLAGLGLLFLALLLVAGSWAWRAGREAGVGKLFTTGEIHELEPARFQSAPLRTAQGGADRIYHLSIQAEAITRLIGRRGIRPSRTELLHVDLWAIDGTTGRLAWRQRLRSFRDGERRGRDLRSIDLLGVDGQTLWLSVEGPLGVSLADGHVVADGAAIEARNPALAGKRIDEPGYIAFGRHGLQLTLDDATQWRIDASDLGAAPRDTPVRDPESIVPPAGHARGATSRFVVRGVMLGNRWLGVLTDKEADTLRKPPVVPGRKPGERPGVMQAYLESRHVPERLIEREAVPYRLWSARVEQVSSAPEGWPENFPDNWGTHPRFSTYEPLPEAPGFLRGGLLQDHPDRGQPLWYREPDSVLVLHVDRLGSAGRLQLSRIAGPRGEVVWRAALPMDELHAVMPGEGNLMLLGSAPPPDAAAARADGEGPHQVAAWLDIANGDIRPLDLTLASLQPPRDAAAADPARRSPALR